MINLQNPTLIPSSTLITDSFTPTGGGDSFLTQLTRVNGSPVSAALEIRSNNGGLLIPRLTTAQINGLNAADALMVYDTTVGAFKFHQSGSYVEYDTGGGAGYGPGVPTYLQDTTSALSDNVSMGTPATNFIGGAIDNSTFGSGIASLGISGDKNSFFGCDAAGGANADINNCSGFGYGALASNQNNTNSAFGSLAANSNTAGVVDAFGFDALGANIDGGGNAAFGSGSLASNVHGGRLTAMGYQALNKNTADESSAFGHQAAYSNVSSAGVNAFGFQAAYSTTSGGNPNTEGTVSAFGYWAAYNNIDGWGLVAMGDTALYINSHGLRNIGIGDFACFSNDNGNDNTAVGYSALGAVSETNYTYSNNSAFGSNSQISIQTGEGNCSLGFNSLYSNIAGNSNCSIGTNSLYNCVGSNNCGFGDSAAYNMSSGNGNCFFGFNSALGSDNLTNCSLFGNGTTIASGLTNASAFGANAEVSVSNALVLGNSANVGIGTSSPANILHTVGAVQFQGISSGYTGSGLIKTQNGFETVSNATATLDFPVPTSIATAIFVKTRIIVNGGGLRAAYAETMAGAFYNGTTTASIGTLPSITFTVATGFAGSAAWSISSNNLRLTLTGDVATTSIWVVSSEKFSTTDTAT